MRMGATRRQHNGIDTMPVHERATRHRCIVRVPEERLPRLYSAWAAYEAVEVPAWAAHKAVEDKILADPSTLALVQELVPDCPLDGHIIFSPVKEPPC